MNSTRIILLSLSLLAGIYHCDAHPTGNMIVAGEYVLWPYVDPIDDTGHHASIMYWKPGMDPQVLLRSEFTASDFMLYAAGKSIYALERRYLQANEQHEIRLVKFEIGQKPEEIIGWTADPNRVGEGGFIVLPDKSILFSTYPSVFKWVRGNEPAELFSLDKPVKRLRPVGPDRLLLLGESSAWLTDYAGKILQEWKDLLDARVDDAPLNRNMIFDADYRNGKLLLAYWGGRRFDIIDKNGRRKTLRKTEVPLTPHWVAWYDDSMLLFASNLVYDGSTPKPELVMYGSNNEMTGIWQEN